MKKTILQDNTIIFSDTYRHFYLDEERDLWIVWDRFKSKFKYYTPNDFMELEGKFSALLEFGTEGEAWRKRYNKLEEARKARELVALMNGGKAGRLILQKRIAQEEIQKMKELSFKDIFPEYYKKKNIVCPFHNDTNASLKFNDKYFYCFGCNKYGSVIDWYMQINNVSFIEAINELKKYI
jgi:hypothetical protein